MDVPTKTCDWLGLGAMNVTKAYEFICVLGGVLFMRGGYVKYPSPKPYDLVFLRVFRLGLLRTGGLEEQRPCPWVCLLVAPGPLLGGSFVAYNR